MPLYEYHCSKCGNNFEVIQKFADAPLTVHEECGGAVERLLSAPAFQFKGSGWYVTDYAKGKSSSESKKSDENGSSKSEEKSDSKPDSKPAESKSESKPAPSSTTKSD
jgi:putative FmdB family regulatory protein